MVLLLDGEWTYEVCRRARDAPFVVNRAELLRKHVREFVAYFTDVSLSEPEIRATRTQGFVLTQVSCGAAFGLLDAASCGECSSTKES